MSNWVIAGETADAKGGYCESRHIARGDGARAMECVAKVPGSRADAELIVRSVNAMPALVEALKYCLNTLKLAEYDDGLFQSHQPDHANMLAEKALALARGGR